MTGVSDLSPLARLEKLAVLELSNTRVKDLAPLAGLRNLRQLDLANTPVENLAPLASLKRLEELDLSRTRVKDLAPLKNLPALRHLALDGLDIGDFAVGGRPGADQRRPGSAARQDLPRLSGMPADGRRAGGQVRHGLTAGREGPVRR